MSGGATGLDPATVKDWAGEKFSSNNIEAHVYSKAGLEFEKYFTLAALSAQTTGDTPESVGMGLTAAIIHAKAHAPYIDITHNTLDTVPGIKLYTKMETDTKTYKIDGEFMGVGGTFYCTTETAGEQCATRLDRDGNILLGLYEPGGQKFVESFTGEAAAGAWEFLPGNKMDKVSSYASYGYWIRTVGDTRTISAFHDYRGMEKAALLGDDFNPANFEGRDGLTGTATYMGGAVGMYAIKDTKAGRFNADVELTARFGTNMDIKGVIDNFDADPEWIVTLRETDIQDSGMIDQGTTEWTMHDDDRVNSSDFHGQWMSRFRDFPTDNANMTALETDNTRPGTVTGVFSAYAPDAKMVGAFGTDLQE